MTLATWPEAESNDETLADQARSGSRAAFAALVGRYQGRVYRLAMRMTQNPSDAEEIVQEAFLRAHRSIRFFHGDSRFGTWLYRIALNEALMRRRAAARRPTGSIDEMCPRLSDIGFALPDGCPEGADVLAERRQLVDRVYAALGALDETHRAAIVLRDLEGLSAAEAAEVLGVSADVVRQRAHRARLKLKMALAR